jgi:hypothetical protein
MSTLLTDYIYKKADKTELEAYAKSADVEETYLKKTDASTTYATKTDVNNSLNNKVDKVSGKQLSTEDYTTAEKKKLGGIADGAQVNLLESISIDGNTITPIDKKVDIPMATMAALGLVRGTSAENGVSINSDGTMEVNTINASKIVQTAGEVLILNGGSSAI